MSSNPHVHEMKERLRGRIKALDDDLYNWSKRLKEQVTMTTLEVDGVKGWLPMSELRAFYWQAEKLDKSRAEAMAALVALNEVWPE